MDTLVELYKKNRHTTDKGDRHSYLPVYDELFYRFKDKENLILEIGILKGDSLNLWAEYFTKSTIYGIDYTMPRRYKRKYDAVHIIHADAYTESAVVDLSEHGKFDIIIDDGSHWVPHQKFVAEKYPFLLTDDGVLVIEDLREHNKNIVNNFSEELEKCTYYVPGKNKGVEDDALIICDKSLL